jgi:hypothetical protein
MNRKHKEIVIATVFAVLFVSVILAGSYSEDTEDTELELLPEMEFLQVRIDMDLPAIQDFAMKITQGESVWSYDPFVLSAGKITIESPTGFSKNADDIMTIEFNFVEWDKITIQYEPKTTLHREYHPIVDDYSQVLLITIMSRG